MPEKGSLRQGLFLTLFFIFLFPFFSHAQNFSWQKLKNLYQLKAYDQLQTSLKQVPPKQKESLEYLFFASLFIKDANQAIKNYQKIFKETNGWLKNEAQKRIYDYYYAQGLYVKATQYSSAKSESKNENGIPSAKKIQDVDSEVPYAIQLGAFSSFENARKRQQTLFKKGIPSEIKIRKINNHNYYCVWVKGRATLTDTENKAKKIKQQFNIEYRIIKK